MSLKTSFDWYICSELSIIDPIGWRDVKNPQKYWHSHPITIQEFMDRAKKSYAVKESNNESFSNRIDKTKYTYRYFPFGLPNKKARELGYQNYNQYSHESWRERRWLLKWIQSRWYQ